MTVRYSNTTGLSLSLAVYLATDNYDYIDDPKVLSVTTLLRPLRQIVLSRRVPQGHVILDVISQIPNRVGASIHDGIERAWVQGPQKALQALGVPQRVADRIRVNPKPEELTEDTIPVYLEQRSERKVGDYTITGKFDFIGDGGIEDFKKTSVYTAMNGTSDEKYILQGSMYRWLNPKLVTKDTMKINWIFLNWEKFKVQSNPQYPPQPAQTKVFHLLSVPETDAWINRKVAQIDRHLNTAEADLPPCGDEDLWRSDPLFKYYKDPNKTKRSTKNFETLQDARIRFVEDGSVGYIKEVPGRVMACKYCPAFAVCTQKDSLIASGDLVMNEA